MNTPEGLAEHSVDYQDRAWLRYTPSELGQWVALLLTRSSHRANREKRAKDIHDARNYLSMLEAHVEQAEQLLNA